MTLKPNLSEDDASRRAVLEQLEACLETPFVPGELETWLDAVVAALGELGPTLHDRIKRRHRLEFEQIAREAPALQRAVEQLSREDGEIAEIHNSLTSRAVQLAAKAASAGVDEGLVGPDAARFVDDGLWFVVRVRKQDMAIRTWLAESINRETPAAD